LIAVVSVDAGPESTYKSSSEMERCDILQTGQPTISTNDSKNLCPTNKQEHETDSIEGHSSCSIPSELGPTCLSHEQSEKVGRPRLFCLQHALQTEELLQNGGGAHAFAICHAGIFFLKRLIFPISFTGTIKLQKTIRTKTSTTRSLTKNPMNLTQTLTRFS
jgi:hypothetical protein